MLIPLVRLAQGFIIATLALSLIPRIREDLKKHYKIILLIESVALFISTCTWVFYVYPKLLGLYQEVPLHLNYQMMNILQIVSFIISLGLLLYSIFIKKVKNNRTLYLTLFIFTVLFCLVLEFGIVYGIKPVFMITIDSIDSIVKSTL